MKWNRINVQNVCKAHVRSFSARQETNEVVEAVFVFHRHGDRTPVKSLVAVSYKEEESSFWKTKVPPYSRYEKLSERFPARIHQGNNSGNFKDVSSDKNGPFGYLTYKGMQQMYHNGIHFSKRYTNPDQHRSFQEKWEIKAFSTNYLRTVKSCQCFLDGLLSTSDEIPTHNHYITLEDPQDESRTSQVEISVRDIKDETLNAFDSSPEVMKKLVRDVIDTPEFIMKDTKSVPLAAQLAHYLPGLTDQSSYSSPTPSGINWIHAADHFICRPSHSMPLSKFLHHQNQPSAEVTLQAMSYATISHLSSRFRSWYQNPAILSEMAGPALNDVKAEMEKAVNSEDTVRKPFNVYSCHDVTILGLLYGVGATPLTSSDDDTEGVGRIPVWPTYATCLTFELVRLQTKGQEDKFVVKVWLNEAAIPTLDVVPVPTLQALSHNKEHLTLTDFTNLVDLLCKRD